MAIKPQVQNLTATSPEILNSIRTELGGHYASMIPMAQNTTESIREIGNVMMQYQPLQNSFLSALVNRIGRVMITSKMYSNPWAGFKKGLLEYGETIEEIFVNICKPHEFDQTIAEQEVFKREIPDVRAAFHTMNYTKFYKTTVSNDQLRQAFLSWEGVTDLIGKIVDAMYTSAAYDEFITMKYLVARVALDGKIYSNNIPEINAVNAKTIVSKIKSDSNNLEYLSTDYNISKVSTHTKKSEQFIILNSEFEALIDVEVLASAFNMSKAEFMGNRVGVDSFAKVDTERLNLLFRDNPKYVPFTADEIKKLATIPAVIVDRDWFMIFDNFQNFTEQYNGEGLYWNYWYHTWKTFSISPFANAILFTTDTPVIKTLSVTPSAVTLPKGSTMQLKVVVDSTGFASNKITWVDNGSLSYIDVNNVLHIDKNETATSLTFECMSAFDPSKTAQVVVTIV